MEVSEGGCFSAGMEEAETAAAAAAPWWLLGRDDLWSGRDRRVDGWPLMGSPLPTAAVCAAYVYLATVSGADLTFARVSRCLPTSRRWLGPGGCPPARPSTSGPS